MPDRSGIYVFICIYKVECADALSFSLFREVPPPLINIYVY